jgi:dihydroorotate dehydrogenase
MVKEAGAKIMEVNYSCPNLVGSKAGAIYQDAEASAQISKVIRNEIGPSVPFVIKIGNLPYEELKAVVAANLPYVDGIAGINTIPGNVRNPDGTQALPGEGRLKSGICGKTIRAVSHNFVENLVKIRAELKADFVIFGVGGMMSPADFDQRLEAGADIVMSATAIMWDPWLAKRWHER